MSKEEEKDMLAQVHNNEVKRMKLWNVANKNTKKNQNGQTVLSPDSPYRNEEGWESTIKDSEAGNR